MTPFEAEHLERLGEAARNDALKQASASFLVESVGHISFLHLQG